MEASTHSSLFTSSEDDIEMELQVPIFISIMTKKNKRISLMHIEKKQNIRVLAITCSVEKSEGNK